MGDSVTYPETIGLDIEVLAVLQARAGSSRLPGKVLKPILGKPMLERQLERVSHAATVAKLIVATTLQTSDDAIEQLCATAGVSFFCRDRGPVPHCFYPPTTPFLPTRT